MKTRQLTPLGHELAKLPLDPKIARLLLAGRQYHCLTEILIIASALSVQDPRERPLDRQEAADAAHKRFADERSDFLAFLKIWAWFEQAVAEKKIQSPVGGRVPQEFSVAIAAARVARTAPAVARTSRRDGHARKRISPATYEQIHKACCAGCSATSA